MKLLPILVLATASFFIFGKLDSKYLLVEVEGELEEDVCKMPKKVGPCYAHITRFYHDTADSKCKKFIYGGCNGNGNNFGTIEECEATCGDKCVKFANRCSLSDEKNKKCCPGLKCKRWLFGLICMQEDKKDAKAPKGQKGTTGESQPTESMGMCTQSKTPCKYVGETYDPHCPKGHFCNIIDGPCGGFCMPRVTCAIDHDCPGCCVNGRCGECKG